ncbi:MAG: YARHG domain-containing protein [Sandaracinaceae bacterium]|nr:YARHG domain-containing protein [Sandaracinaceae bacterium]
MRAPLGAAVALAVWTLGAPALANDASFGGEGADLAPLVETRVRMASEEIVIEQPRPDADGWRVTATYAFENPTDEAVAITMGFPERHCGPDEDCGFDNRFLGLRTTVRGEPVAHRVSRVGRRHGWAPRLGRAYLFDVRFEPRERVEIVHRYQMGSSGSVDGGDEVAYVTRTGALWAGPIGRARFVVRTHRRPWRLSFPAEYQLARYVEEPTAAGPGRTEIVFEQTEWSPRHDLHVYLGRPWNGIETTSAISRCPAPGATGRYVERTREALRELSDADLATCRNMIFAAHGRPFASAAARETFYRPARRASNPFGFPELSFGGVWSLLGFTENPSWTPSLVTASERAYVGWIREEETRRRAPSP